MRGKVAAAALGSAVVLGLGASVSGAVEQVPKTVVSSPSFVRAWGSHGSRPGQFDAPAGVATMIDPYVGCAAPGDTGVSCQFDVAVVDSGNDRVQLFDDRGKFLRMWGSAGSGPGQFNDPVAIAAVAVDAAVYVVDAGNDRVEEFTFAGKFVRQWGTHGSGAGQFDHPAGITAAGFGVLYVADSGNNRIEAFKPDGRFLGQWAGPGGTSGQLSAPHGVVETLSRDGTTQLVLVADGANHRIVTATAPTDDSPFAFGSSPLFAAGVAVVGSPTAIAADDTAFDAFVVDGDAQRVVEIDTHGRARATIGSPGRGAGQLDAAQGLAIGIDFSGLGNVLPPSCPEPRAPDTSDTRVYVADTGNDRIDVFRFDATKTTYSCPLKPHGRPGIYRSIHVVLHGRLLRLSARLQPNVAGRLVTELVGHDQERRNRTVVLSSRSLHAGGALTLRRRVPPGSWYVTLVLQGRDHHLLDRHAARAIRVA